MTPVVPSVTPVAPPPSVTPVAPPPSVTPVAPSETPVSVTPIAPPAAPSTPPAVAPTATPGTGTGTGSGTGSGSGGGGTCNTTVPYCPEQTKYANYYAGCGVYENTTNPGDPTGDTTSPNLIIDQFGSTYAENDTCGALDACINTANYYLPDHVYQSFDLHYINDSEQASQSQWYCYLYLGNNTNGSYFDTTPNQTYLSVFNAYGYYLITDPTTS